MQTRKPEKSNVELPAFKITGTDPVRGSIESSS